MDAGQQLLDKVNARVAAGMAPAEAKARVFADAANRELVSAWHEGGGPVRQTERLGYSGDPLGRFGRRVRADEMIEGKPYVHLCCAEPEGGIFEMAA